MSKKVLFRSNLFSKTAPRIFLTFCMSVEDNRAHRWSKIVFLNKFLIPDYKGVSVVLKKVFFHFLDLSSKTVPRISLIFCMSVEDNRVNCLSQMVLLKKVLISDYRGLSVHKGVFFTFLSFSQQRL